MDPIYPTKSYGNLGDGSVGTNIGFRPVPTLGSECRSVAKMPRRFHRFNEN